MFENSFKLHHDEKIILYVRKHWIFLAWDIAGVVILFLLPSVLIWILQFVGYVPDFNIFGVSFESFTDIMIYAWGIFCWLMIAEKYTDYALDFWVVTNKRIVESELVKLFDRQLSTLELQDIEDITIRNEGFFANYFGYGSLEVQTAGAQNEFRAPRIAHPEDVQQIMFDAKLKDEQEKKNIEKDEVEQITQRVMREEGVTTHIPHDQKLPKDDTPTNLDKDFPENAEQRIHNGKNKNYDWAHISEKQAADIRNLQEQIEEVESKYKKGIDDALRTE